jgi:acyl-CoA reductase-like NAD-dependent aldehyde dehydrogenase
VGWQLKANAGKKKVTLELGGNAGQLLSFVGNCVVELNMMHVACIVDDLDETLEVIVDRIIIGAFYQSGQVSMFCEQSFRCCLNTLRVCARV